MTAKDRKEAFKKAKAQTSLAQRTPFGASYAARLTMSQRKAR